MSIEKDLQKRSEGNCELCKANDNNKAYILPASPNKNIESHLWLCNTCSTQIENPSTANENHWRFLNETIWSELPVAKIASWRMLHKLPQYSWTQDLIDIAYLDEEELEWAKANGDGKNPDDVITHVDCFGAVLQNGDNVVLTKSLEVKGATFNAKVGTVVHNIRLVSDNADQIEGRVNNSMIVILTKYLRKVAK
jgi:protein PhnA